MKFEKLTAAILAATLAACGGGGSSSSGSSSVDTGSESETPTETGGGSTDTGGETGGETGGSSDFTASPIDNSSLVKPAPQPIDDNSVRNWADLGIEQFDIEFADMQMVHDTMTGELPFKLDDPEAVLNCETLTALYIDRILQYNDFPQPNGGLAISGALMINPHAMDIARELDEKFEADKLAGNNNGFGNRYIHCMPVLLKDNYDTFDHPSSSASPSMLGHQAGVDAPSVEGLRQAGAVILGKAQQDEFAYFTTGFSGRTVLVTNPYNTQESPSGSSSGTGASIAARFAVGGTGSDTCMSIRRPSSVNGLVGIRPSVGVVSRKGIFPLSHVRDMGGPMTKTVRDTTLMLTAMASIDSVDDPDTDLFPLEDRPDTYLRFIQEGKAGVSGRNIGILKQLGTNNAPDGGTGFQGVRIAEVANELADEGANIFLVNLPAYRGSGGGGTHYDTNQYFFEFFRDGGTSERRCLVSGLSTVLSGQRPAHHPSCIGRQGIVESGLIGPRTAGLVGLSATGALDDVITDAELTAIARQREYTTAVMDGKLDIDAGVVKDVDPVQVGDATPLEVNGMAASVTDLEGNPVTGVDLDVLLLSPGPSGGRTCDFGSTTQMGSIVVPIGIQTGPGTPYGMEIFTRRFEEGKGLRVAYAYEQIAVEQRVANEQGYITNPDISPQPLRNNETIDEFNRRIQLAIMAALDEEVTSVLDMDAMRKALNEITGNSDYD